MLDNPVGNSSPVGGAQVCSLCDSELVDNADEGTRPHRWPDGKDAYAHHASLALGNGNRRRRNEEQVAQVVDVVAGPLVIDVARKRAYGGVEIGETGASDVNLHEGLSSRSQQALSLDDPRRG